MTWIIFAVVMAIITALVSNGTALALMALMAIFGKATIMGYGLGTGFAMAGNTVSYVSEKRHEIKTQWEEQGTPITRFFLSIHEHALETEEEPCAS